MRFQGFYWAFAAIAAFTIHAAAQTEKPIKLITWFGPGAITMPASPDWKPEMLNVYDEGQRPVFQFNNPKTSVVASFIIFENLSGKPTASGCREDAINPILEHQGKLISQRTDSEVDDGHGGTYAATSYLTKLTETAHNHDRYLFAGNAKTCAEVHVSTVTGHPDEEAHLQAGLAEFHPDLDYAANSYDYFMLASLLYPKGPMLAAPYYKQALDRMPTDGKDPVMVKARRVATDNIVMALGMSGDLKDSRAVAQKAIEADPDYPLNYYNLACADAEEGKASDAKAHLQQAFDRRANTIKGETLPDPAKDDSILKLKKNKEFWAFVEGLPKS